MLVAINMRDFVYSKIQQVSEIIDIHKRFCELICEYINDNVEITYKWEATNSQGQIDPITIFKTQSKNKGSFGLSYLTNATLAMKYWCFNMSNVIKNDMEIIVPDTWEFPKLFFGLQGLLNIEMQGETTYESASLNFCDRFINSFKSSFINNIPIPGVHVLDSIYIGTATMITIS